MAGLPDRPAAGMIWTSYHAGPPMSDTDKTPQPLDALWQAPAMLWVLISGECLAVVLALASGPPPNRWVYFGLASLLIQWVALLSLAALYLLRRSLREMRPQRLTYLALGLLLANTWLVLWLAWLLLRQVWPMSGEAWLMLALHMTGIILAVGFLGLAAFQNHWRGRMHAVRAKHAELQALQARIRPHFLFNTLNTGAALVHQHPEQAEQLLLDLADLFRAALAEPRQIPLEDELALARHYLEIEALRFGERLQVRWNLPHELPAVMVPALSIQPLVENAVRHGVERMASGEIEITVSTTPNTVVIRISNPVLQSDGSPTPGHKVGLNAAQARIEAQTGGLGSVKTQVLENRFVATVQLPMSS